MGMFCYQCEQACNSTGCEVRGVCGKDSTVAALQDVMIYQLKGIGFLAHQARLNGFVNKEVNRFTVDALFMTLTNVNFDSQQLEQTILQGEVLRENILKRLGMIPLENLPPAAKFSASRETFESVQGSPLFGILQDHPDQDIRSLMHLVTYGLKGVAAYVYHATALGHEDDSIYAYLHEALAALNRRDLTVAELVELSMRCGTINIRAMELLDEAHTTRFGHPVPTEVSTGLRKGPAIIISGHDLLDLEKLLQATEGKGISVYTHGEMLPAHGYPQLKKFGHLAGHFGTAWQNQQREFDGVPAAIFFTTNCIQQPKPGYQDRVFTGGVVGWPGMRHIQNHDYAPLIEKAIALGGFQAEVPGGKLMTGFGRNAVLSVADKVIGAVKSGAVKHFFLVGGCDGAKSGRNYYTDLAKQVPTDCMILTLACGKFRFNHLEFGTIGGLPRLLDIGQCNDAYSAIKIAEALAGAFDCGVNELPLSLILSWYEQKAVAILLSLLSLGIKGIRIGPSLPAFLSPNIVNYLVETFDLKPITTPEQDLTEILQTA